jgi:hypothetical protein
MPKTLANSFGGALKSNNEKMKLELQQSHITAYGLILKKRESWYLMLCWGAKRILLRRT